MSAFKFRDKMPPGVKILEDKTAEASNINEKHMYDYKAIRDPSYTNFALYSCFLDGHPTTAIVSINNDEDNPEEAVEIAPLFVAVTPDMKITNHAGVEAEFHGPEGVIQ